MKYRIFLYNAGKRCRNIGNFDKDTVALESFQKKILANRILFAKLHNWDGQKTDYELVLLGPAVEKGITDIKDEMGRNVVLKGPEGYCVLKIDTFFVEETFVHKNSETRYQFKKFARDFIISKKGPKTFYTVKNKLVVEYISSGAIEVFVLKNQDDAVRLNDTVRNFCDANNIHSNFYFPFQDGQQRKLLYDMIEEKTGITRKYMSRESTR